MPPATGDVVELPGGGPCGRVTMVRDDEATVAVPGEDAPLRAPVAALRRAYAVPTASDGLRAAAFLDAARGADAAPDFHLSVNGGARVGAHAALLGWRSPYVAELLRSGCTEAEERRVDLRDLPATSTDHLRAVLRWAYGGELWCGSAVRLAGLHGLAKTLQLGELDDALRRAACRFRASWEELALVRDGGLKEALAAGLGDPPPDLAADIAEQAAQYDIPQLFHRALWAAPPTAAAALRDAAGRLPTRPAYAAALAARAAEVGAVRFTAAAALRLDGAGARELLRRDDCAVASEDAVAGVVALHADPAAAAPSVRLRSLSGAALSAARALPGVPHGELLDAFCALHAGGREEGRGAVFAGGVAAVAFAAALAADLCWVRSWVRRLGGRPFLQLLGNALARDDGARYAAMKRGHGSLRNYLTGWGQYSKRTGHCMEMAGAFGRMGEGHEHFHITALAPREQREGSIRPIEVGGRVQARNKDTDEWRDGTVVGIDETDGRPLVRPRGWGHVEYKWDQVQPGIPHAWVLREQAPGLWWQQSRPRRAGAKRAVLRWLRKGAPGHLRSKVMAWNKEGRRWKRDKLRMQELDAVGRMAAEHERDKEGAPLHFSAARVGQRVSLDAACCAEKAAALAAADRNRNGDWPEPPRAAARIRKGPTTQYGMTGPNGTAPQHIRVEWEPSDGGGPPAACGTAACKGRPWVEWIGRRRWAGREWEGAAPARELHPPADFCVSQNFLQPREYVRDVGHHFQDPRLLPRFDRGLPPFLDFATHPGPTNPAVPLPQPRCMLARPGSKRFKVGDRVFVHRVGAAATIVSPFLPGGRYRRKHRVKYDTGETYHVKPAHMCALQDSVDAAELIQRMLPAPIVTSATAAAVVAAAGVAAAAGWKKSSAEEPAAKRARTAQ